MVEAAHNAVMTNMGQCCIAGSRTFVHEDIYDEFVKKSRERALKRVIGDPWENPEQGPQVRIDGSLIISFFKQIYIEHANANAKPNLHYR